MRPDVDLPEITDDAIRRGVSTASPNSKPPSKPTSTSTMPTPNRSSGPPLQPTSSKKSLEDDER